MTDGFYVPPKPAIIQPPPAGMLRPGDPQFVMPAMLMGGLGIKTPGDRRRPANAARSLYDAISTAGLTANLIFCHDAAAGASYPGGASWLDLSGNGHDFNLGTTSSAEGSDPTFNGAVGGGSSSEYFSGDGGDCFTYKTGNPAAFNNLHKDNAAWTLVVSGWPVASAGLALFGSAGNALANIGAAIRVRGTDKFTIEIFNGSGAAFALSKDSDATVSTGAFTVLGASINEAGGNVSFMWQKGAYLQVGGSNTFDATYSSPSASNASFTAQIGAAGNSAILMPSGARIAQVALWSTALTKANLDAIYNDAAVKTRYGL